MWVAHPAAAPGEVTPIPGLSGTGGAALAHRDSGVALARPLANGERIDLDRASALEIARLPKVGPRLAKTIVADREALGPFGSLAALDRVPGVGEGLLKAIGDHATFSAPPRTAEGGPPSPPQLGAGTDGTSAPGRPTLLDLNSASAAELETLPFIGPGLALRIVAFRQKHGRFPVVDSLVQVPGIGPSVLAKVRDRVRTE
jgi:competence ComEA-like helix-hairpin-helix protein